MCEEDHDGCERVIAGPASLSRREQVQIIGAAVAGDTGWESGTYTATNAAGTAVDSGSYLSVSHKSNGKWLYYRDTYNSDRSLPATAPAEKK